MFSVAFLFGNYNGKVDILSAGIALLIYRYGNDCYTNTLEARVIYISELFYKKVYRPFNHRA